MGYMGFGMQSWISNAKPKPFFGRRNNPGTEHPENISGHDISNLYHLKQNKLENLSQKKPSSQYMQILRKRIRNENRRQRVYGLVIMVFSISILVLTFVYLSHRFDLF